jgi:hypothetical protein
MTTPVEDERPSSDERRLGVELFNATWEQIGSRADDELMVHMAHASAYHWAAAPECKPENQARSAWLLARVYALVGRAEPSLHYAGACFDWCERSGLADWDLAFAYEALARANRVAGDDEAARSYVELARSVEIADDEDRELLETDLATIWPSA